MNAIGSIVVENHGTCRTCKRWMPNLPKGARRPDAVEGHCREHGHQTMAGVVCTANHGYWPDIFHRSNAAPHTGAERA